MAPNSLFASPNVLLLLISISVLFLLRDRLIQRRQLGDQDSLLQQRFLQRKQVLARQQQQQPQRSWRKRQQWQHQRGEQQRKQRSQQQPRVRQLWKGSDDGFLAFSRVTGSRFVASKRQ